jgi:hypothetical protein
MTQRGLMSRALIAAIAGAVLTEAVRADDAAPANQRKLLGEVTEGAVQHPCVLLNCATILAVHHRESWEASGPLSARGISRLPPVTQQSFNVQQRKEVWIIEVRKRDGTVQAFLQSYPALFQVGDEVLVEGDRIRAAD